MALGHTLAAAEHNPKKKGGQGRMKRGARCQGVRQKADTKTTKKKRVAIGHGRSNGAGSFLAVGKDRRIHAPLLRAFESQNDQRNIGQRSNVSGGA